MLGFKVGTPIQHRGWTIKVLEPTTGRENYKLYILEVDKVEVLRQINIPAAVECAEAVTRAMGARKVNQEKALEALKAAREWALLHKPRPVVNGHKPNRGAFHP